MSDIVSQVSVQEYTEATSVPAPGIWELYKWWIITGVFLLIIICVATYFLVKWLGKLKNPPGIIDDKLDAYISIGRRQARKGYYNSYFSPSKNAPIYLIWNEGTDTHPRLKTSFWGWYMGDMISETGFMLLLFTNRPLHWLFWFLPKIEPLWLPKTGEIEIKRGYDTDKHQYEVHTIKGLPHNLENFTGEMVLVAARSIDEEKGLYKPVLLDKTTNQPIDTHIVAFSQIENCALKDFVYHTTNAYVDNTRRGFEMNTNMMREKKVHDVGGEVTQ